MGLHEKLLELGRFILIGREELEILLGSPDGFVREADIIKVGVERVQGSEGVLDGRVPFHGGAGCVAKAAEGIIGVGGSDRVDSRRVVAHLGRKLRSEVETSEVVGVSGELGPVILGDRVVVVVVVVVAHVGVEVDVREGGGVVVVVVFAAFAGVEATIACAVVVVVDDDDRGGGGLLGVVGVGGGDEHVAGGSG